MAGHEHLGDLGAGIGSPVLRIVLLAAVPVVAGFALLRGFLGEQGRFATVWVMYVAAAAAGMELLLSGGLNLPEQLVPLLLAAIAVPVYLIRSRDERFAVAVGRARAVAPFVFAGLAVYAAVQFGIGWFAGAGPERTAILLHTGVLLGLVAVVWFAVARPRGRAGARATHAGAAVLAMALLAGSAHAVTLAPPEPVPGVATAARLELGPGVDVVVVPNLPGWNLVHVGSATASAGTAANSLTAARSRPGTTGGWLTVRLPAGRGHVWVGDGGRVDSLTTNTGSTGTAPAALTGPDGPECASALLGRMLAAGTASGDEPCPSERLDPLDAAVLRASVESLATQGHRRVALAGDRSPRGLAAARTVRDFAARQGVDVVEPGTAAVPLLVTSGWADAAALLREVAAGDVPAAGTYPAPWLFTAPLLDIRAGQHVGLRFDPAADSFRRYVLELRREYPGQPASATGYRAWCAQLRYPDDGAVRFYTADAVSTLD